MSETLYESQTPMDSCDFFFKKVTNKNQRRAICNFFIESYLIDELNTLADLWHISRSELIRMAVKKFLKEVSEE